MSEWDEHAAGWDDDEAVQAYAEGAYAALTALTERSGVAIGGSVACDFGCGTGVLTERLADLFERIDAVDTSASMRAMLAAKGDRQGRTNVRILEALPAEPQGYDLIVCSSVLSFVDDHPDTVRRLVEHLAPGGLFVQWDWEAEPNVAESEGLAAADIAAALTDAGLDDVSVRIGFEVSVGGDVMRPLMGSGRRPAGTVPAG